MVNLYKTCVEWSFHGENRPKNGQYTGQTWSWKSPTFLQICQKLEIYKSISSIWEAPDGGGGSISHLPLLLRPISLLPNRCSRVFFHFSHFFALWLSQSPISQKIQSQISHFSQNLTLISHLPNTPSGASFGMRISSNFRHTSQKTPLTIF